MSLWTDSGIPTSGFRNREDFEFRSYDIMHESNEMSFWMMLYHLPCVLEDVCFFGYLLIMDMIWNVNIFLRIFDWYPYLAVM